MELDLQIGELDLNDIGEWPILAKLGVVVGLMVLVIGGVFYFDTQPQLQSWSSSFAEQATELKKFEEAQKTAAQLEQYKQQLEEMKNQFKDMRKRLPSKTEIAPLLVSVSKEGLNAGLEFELFKPQAEVPKKDFYEKSIDIKVIGTFHQFGVFVSQLAALQRIVTIHNVTITPRDKKLEMSAIIKTYRYSEK